MSDNNKHAAPHTPTAEEAATIKQQIAGIADGVKGAEVDQFASLSNEDLLALIKKMSVEKDVLITRISAAKKTMQKRIGSM